MDVGSGSDGSLGGGTPVIKRESAEEASKIIKTEPSDQDVIVEDDVDSSRGCPSVSRVLFQTGVDCKDGVRPVAVGEGSRIINCVRKVRCGSQTPTLKAFSSSQITTKFSINSIYCYPLRYCISYCHALGCLNSLDNRNLVLVNQHS